MSRTDGDNEMEALLGRHAVAGPALELRRRVTSLRSSGSFFWEAAAASLLVGACLVQIMTSRPAVRQMATPARDLTEIRQMLRHDFSEEEVQLATMTLASGSELWPLPQIDTTSHRTLLNDLGELQ